MFRSRSIIKTDQLPRETLAWVLFAQGFALFPLFFYLPLWLPAFWLAVTVWRVQIFRGVWTFPSGLTKFILTAICVILLAVTFKGSLGVEPMVSFLLCGFILKLIEVYKRSDASLLLFICFIALGAQFLFSQTILDALYALICLLIIIAAQRSVFLVRDQAVKKQLKHSAILLAQSLPLMLIMFVVMPRLGQLWAVPSQNNVARSGFGDSMTPGSFSNLIKSRDLAFRVTFESKEGNAESVTSDLPPPRDRYWRGLTLEYYDGRTWRQRWFRQRDGVVGSVQRWRRTPSSWNVQTEPQSRHYSYSVILEPHNQTWLFALMTPTSLQSPQLVGAGFHEDKLIVAQSPINTRVQYKMQSAIGDKVDVGFVDTESRRRNLQVPDNVNPRAQSLVQAWLEEGKSPREIIQAAMNNYNASFTYTLNPPVLGADSIDEFLFITQRGFCEHFASSFVYLMRLAGIPSRVVLGYQGGEVNSVENYIMVRQSDAHAWAEVWLADEGWMRVDPTAAVAPSRIEEGLESAVEASERGLLGGGIISRFSLLVNYWDLLGYKWHSLVLDYDDEGQKNLFEKLFGGTQIWRIALWFVGACIVILLSTLALALYSGTNKHRSRELQLYQRFQKKLARRGLLRSPGETPSAFAARAIQHFPQWQAAIERITRLFLAIAYRNQRQLNKQLEKEIQLFPR